MSRFLTYSMGLLAVAGTAALLLAPGTAESQRPRKPAAAPRVKKATPSISIQNHVFNNGQPWRINGGTSVTWQNLDVGERHTATSDSTNPPQRVAIETGFLTGGTNTDTSAPVFFPAGDYVVTYHCRVHPDMTGTIIVGNPAPQNRKVKPAARPHRHRVGAPVAPADLALSRDLPSMLDLVLYEDRSPPAMACEPIQE